MAVLATALTVLTTEQWTHFSWSVFYGLSQPWLVILLLLSLILVMQRLSHSRWRRKLSRSFTLLLLIYLIVISPPIASLLSQGLVQFVPIDSGAQSDAIVVLSRGTEAVGSRYELAIRLWQTNRAPRIFVTAENNVQYMLSLLHQKNISSRVLSGTACALTTQDEASSTAVILGPRGIRKIILITDPPHMLRSLLTFKSFGFSVIPDMSPLSPQLSSITLSLLALREYVGLLSYAALGRFQPHPLHELEHPPQVQLQAVANRQCKIDL